MKLNYSKYTSLFIFLITATLICSCGSDDYESPDDSNQTVRDGEIILESDASDKTESAIADDLESFLNEGETFFPLTATGAEDSANTSYESTKVQLDHLGSTDVDGITFPVEEPVDDKSVSDDREAEKVLSNLEEGTISHQKSIDELRKINSRKDKTIASIKQLNEELLIEINRLKGGGAELRVSESKSDETASDKLFGLRSEVKNLRGNLLIKAKEIQDLRIRNDSLEGRISVLELNPSKKLMSSSMTPRQKDLSKVVSSLSNKNISMVETSQERRLFAGGCNLQFDAVVTALNGKNKEAFYSEFFIIEDDFENVLRRGGVKLTDFSGIDSYAELWARSRKNSFLFPNVQKNIRSLLLKLVENGKGQRVRTDINGAATLENLPSGNFFIVGTASLGKVGVTWDVPVVLQTGTNKLSLTLANSTWSL
jgi:hypothetical protein